MDEARVKAELFVKAALRMAGRTGNPGAVLRRGDPDAGGILCILRGLDGLVVLSQLRTGAGEAAWMRATGAAPVTEETAQAYVDRQTSRDPDLWVVEFDSRDFTPPFEAKIVP